MRALTELDKAVLAFAGRHPETGPDDATILDEFGVSAVNYRRLLEQLLADPAARDYDPQLVTELRRRTTIAG